jgi:hypothetical protein
MICYEFLKVLFYHTSGDFAKCFTTRWNNYKSFCKCLFSKYLDICKIQQKLFDTPTHLKCHN